ncbi:MAG TPA: glycosyltransferase [Steroidobacteraceae bacterium]|nr:glycosyltransferase [Steroidobacteraceae bacterium]
MPKIEGPYLLITSIPLYRAPDGRTYAGELWYKDLALHLSYLTNFTLACPHIDKAPPDNSIALDDNQWYSRIRFVVLPDSRSIPSALLHLPPTIYRLWKAIGRAEYVHSGVAGWPIPYGWIASPLARMRRKHSIIIVESAPWRLPHGISANFTSRIKAILYERMAHWSLRRADLAIFTQDEYRRSFFGANSKNGHVIHASWIDDGVTLSENDARMLWRSKVSPSDGRLRLLFAGRLEVEKGVAVLLDAMRDLAQQRVRVTLDILGAGSLEHDCRELAGQLGAETHINVLGTVAYGQPLYQLLQRYHALVVPSLSDEQPRIVYDAYAQALPVLGTKTPGLQDCILENRTGWLVEPSNPNELVHMLLRALNEIDVLQQMGINALHVARSMTHQEMHRKRHQLLVELP